MKKYNIGHWLDNATQLEKNNALACVHAGQAFYSADEVENTLKNYTLFNTVRPVGEVFAQYRANTQYNLWRIFTAMNIEYNPVNNYDLTETDAHTITHGNIERTRAAGDNSYVETVITPETTQKHYTTTSDDASTGRLESYDTPEGDTTTKTTDHTTTTDTETHSAVSKTFNDETYTGDVIETTTHEKHGQIGVMTYAQILGGEYEARRIDLLSDYVRKFIREFAYYVGGDFEIDDGDTE